MHYQLALVVAALALVAGACDDAADSVTFPATDGEELRQIDDLSQPDTASLSDTPSDNAADGLEPVPDTVDADAAAPGLGPPYPIVFAHGMGGFDDSLTDYFFGLRTAMEATTEDFVITEVDPFNNTETRGDQLIAAIETYLETTPYRRVVIIGHSQGGLDARWVAYHRPKMVEAVVTVGTPHRGTPVADAVLGLVSDPNVQDVVDGVVGFVGQRLYDEFGNETSLFESIRSLSTERMDAFNQTIIDQPEVSYYSVAGRSDDIASDESCFDIETPEFIDQYWDVVDPLDPALYVLSQFIDGASAGPSPNDGMVHVESARWGRFLGCVPADHADEIGQISGDHPGGNNTFNHIQFYLDLTGWIRAEGH